MKNVYWLNELSKSSLSTAGGKGANLAEMINSGFPVPNAFIVGAETYFDFVKLNGLEKTISEETKNLNYEDTAAVQKASQAIKTAILNARMQNDVAADITRSYNKLCDAKGVILSSAEEVFVAVRSSATAEDLPGASFAGQQATFLNVKGSERLVNAVKACWASLFEARAIYYRNEKGFEHLRVGIAVVVQKMVQSEKSGIAFTVDPVTQNENNIIIEAGFGLGEAIVSGSVTPDKYIVDKRNFEIIEKVFEKQERMLVKTSKGDEWVAVEQELQEVQKLSNEEINALARICADIEKHYAFPQDIEFAFEGKNIFIVQSRAITTLKNKGIETAKTLFENAPQNASVSAHGTGKVLLQGLPASPGIATGAVKIILDLSHLNKIQKVDILVTKMTTPDFVPAMKRATAIITDEGGMTAHAAIVSRELGIPCIVGSRKATSILSDGQVITVDAKRGVVYEGKVEFAQPAAEQAQNAPAAAYAQEIITGTKVYCNIATVELADKVAQKQVDGVGLMRAEFMIANMGVHPRKIIKDGKQEEFINNLAEGMRKVCQAFYPRPVVYRATDFRTNEYRNLEGGAEFEPHEENPMIGYRGCFRYVKEPEVFKMELHAIKKVREEFGLKNLWLMIPFVRRTGELKNVKDLMHAEGLFQTRDFKLWIMVEVPSTVFIIEKFLDLGIDGISFGTNDLTQLILGVDRDSGIVAEEFDERHEAVLRALKHVIVECNARGVTSSFCGQAVSVYPEVAEAVVRYGITSVSVNPDSIETARKIIASVEKKIMLEKLIGLDSKGETQHKYYG
ncbi:MAG TPA: phosphoenolpyruvate synthase [Candidatus Norongarragalinales archaeon]|nr:phosphoenolpyruvate synthase [Candidatus Norongarragalinales archaeon]